MTKHDLLRFDSIFDLLTRLGFTEDQEQERTVAPQGAHAVAFTQTAGRTVAEFVGWAIKTGLLVPYLAETPDACAERAVSCASCGSRQLTRP